MLVWRKNTDNMGLAAYRPVHNLTGLESRIYFLKYKETIYYEHHVAISKDLVDWGEALAGTEVNISTLQQKVLL